MNGARLHNLVDKNGINCSHLVDKLFGDSDNINMSLYDAQKDWKSKVQINANPDRYEIVSERTDGNKEKESVPNDKSGFRGWLGGINKGTKEVKVWKMKIFLIVIAQRPQIIALLT